MATSTPPKVFLSYSWDSEAHGRWVERLAADLRTNGVDAVLDRWDAGPGRSLAQFMEEAIAAAGRVIIVATPNYVAKADGEIGGVGYEKMIAVAELLRDQKTNKFVPLLRSASDKNELPRFLGTRLYIDFRDDLKYHDRLEDLLNDLHGVPPRNKPPIGAYRPGDVAQSLVGPEMLARAASAGPRTSVPADFRLSTKRDNPQWADYRDIPLDCPVPWSVRCTICTESPYFRFGFKLFTEEGRVFGDASIRSFDANLIVHVGRNNWNRPKLGISEHDLFYTASMSGNHLEDNDRALFRTDPRLTTHVELAVDRSYCVSASVDGTKFFSRVVPPAICRRVAVYGWGDREEFEIDVSEFTVGPR